MRRLTILIGILFCATNFFSRNRIMHHDKEIFLSGINLAWIDYARDIIDFDESEFTRALK